MKRKHYNIIAIILWILALIVLRAFDNPYSTGLSWNIFLAIVLAVIGIIIYYSANRCPYCDNLIRDGFLKPAKYCPHCGKDISNS